MVARNLAADPPFLADKRGMAVVLFRSDAQAKARSQRITQTAGDGQCELYLEAKRRGTIRLRILRVITTVVVGNRWVSNTQFSMGETEAALVKPNPQAPPRDAGTGAAFRLRIEGNNESKL